MLQKFYPAVNGHGISRHDRYRSAVFLCVCGKWKKIEELNIDIQYNSTPKSKTGTRMLNKNVSNKFREHNTEFGL